MSLGSVLMKDTLVADGFTAGGTGQWSVWVGKQPTSPDRTITIYDAPGLAPNPKWLLDYPTVQFRIRGGQPDYKVAGDKAIEVRNRLLGRESYDAIDGLGDRIVSITALGDVNFVGCEENTVRPEFIFNLRLIIEPSPLTSPTHREPL
jgi:hypothetical protein